jgi:cytochrome oxidase Cu insertion factor (SCO1/SenC/PrrC family)
MRQLTPRPVLVSAVKGIFSALFVASLSVTTASAAEVPDSAEKVTPLLIGATAPDVKLTTPDGEDVSLKDLLAKQRSVLVFYRGGW